MHLRFGLSVVLAFSVAAPAVAAEQAGPQSWGKLNVSYLQYRTDVAECGYEITRMKIDPKTSSVSSAPTFVSGDVPTVAEIQEMALRQEEDTRRYLGKLREEIIIKAQMELDACLEGRGYRRFRLTPDQVQQLRTAKPGSQARQQYLYSLAANPQVMASQSF